MTWSLCKVLVLALLASAVQSSVIRHEEENVETTTLTAEATTSIREKRSLDPEQLETTTFGAEQETTTLSREKRSVEQEMLTTTVGSEILGTTLPTGDEGEKSGLTTEVAEKSEQIPENEEQKFVVMTPMTSVAEKVSTEETSSEKNKKKKKKKQENKAENTDDDSGTDDSDDDDD